MQTTTLRPGLLVGLSTTIEGNVRYFKQDIEQDHLDSDGARRARWETERTINDPAEYEEAVKVRGKCRSLVTAVCSKSKFGLLCPNTREAALRVAVREAQELANAFNARAGMTRIDVSIITGKIASDDLEATKRINEEIRELLDAMESGVRNLDVAAIRDAANRAKSVSGMVAPGASERLQKAIDAARGVARVLVRAGETASQEVDQAVLRTLSESRTAFLDLDNEGAVPIAETVVNAPAIDLDPTPFDEEPPTPATAPSPPELEFDLDDSTPTNAAPLAATLDLFNT